MGKSSSSPPPAPDPARTAAAQAAANKEAVLESAKVNQFNQVTPYGSVTYTGAIGSPDRTQTVSLPPELQKALEGQQRITGGLTQFAEQYVPRVAESLSTPFNTANIGVARPEASPEERQRIEDALFARLEPRFAQDEERLLTRLANQGIDIGSEAHAEGMDDLTRARNDARLATIGQAGNEYARDFSMQNQSYQQALSDALLNRTQGLNEVSALLQGAPAIQNPGTPNTAQYQVNAPDIMGAHALQYQGQMNAYNQRVGQQNALMGGLAGLAGSLGGAAILASDRRVKTDIKRVGKMDNGLPVYLFRYIGGGPVMMGVMAQDVEKVMPEAVIEFANIKHVDYGRLA